MGGGGGRISTVFFVVLNFLFKERTGLYKYLGRHPIGEKDTNSFTHSHTHTHGYLWQKIIQI